MTTDDEFIGQLEGYLDEYEGTTPLPDAVRDAVRAQLRTTTQIGPVSGLMRDLTMDNNIIRVGLVAAALVIIAVIAINLLPGSPAPGGEPTPSPSAAASATQAATPEATPSAYVISIPGLADGRVTLIVPPGWTRNGWYVEKDGTYLSVWPVPVTNVYTDVCQWEGSLPDPPVGPTVEDMATALANQPIRASTVEDVTLAGYSGKVVHQSIPANLDFTTCDQGLVGVFTEAGSDEPSRNLQAPGELDDTYILDVEGVRVVIGVAWLPTSPGGTVTELEGMLDSLTIQP